MLKIYCQDCGSPTAYSNIKPKFCSSCGKPFDKNIIVNPVQLQKPTITNPQNFKIKKPILRAEDYDNEDIYDEEDQEIDATVPDINKLDFDITDIKPNKIKMKDIISDIPEEALSATEPVRRSKKVKNIKVKNKVKNQEFLNQFKAEAGTLRPSARRAKEPSDG